MSTETCNISETVQDSTKVTNLLRRTNRKSHMHFRLVPKSMTLDDPEGLNGRKSPKRTLAEKSFYGAHQKKLNEGRPQCQKQNIGQ